MPKAPTQLDVRNPTNSPREARRALGASGEALAAEHLRRLGYQLLARNVRTRHGEIDLIAFDGRTLVFISPRGVRQIPCVRRGRATG
jgi:putative endonuclease